MLKNLAVFVLSANAIALNDSDPKYGAPIAICNGLNNGNCVTAEEVNTKKIRRAGKRAAPGDPDYEAQEKADAARTPVPVLAQKKAQDPSTGAIIPICNGANKGKCTTAEEVVTKKIRRAGKRAAPGDPDYEA